MITVDGEEAVVKAAIGPDVAGYVMKRSSEDSLTKAIQRAYNKPLDLKLPGAMRLSLWRAGI